MKIKDVYLYDKLLKNIQHNLNEINQIKYTIQFENNEIIKNEMVNDLKMVLVESYKSLNDILNNNQKKYIHDNITNIYKMLQYGNSIEKIDMLYESLLTNFRNIYFVNNYENELNIIIENYIHYTHKIINSINDIYKKENMILTEQLNINFDDYYNNTVTGLMEGLIESISNILGKIKTGFGNKHDKLLLRDKDWLKSNKKKLLNLDFNNVELEVVNDYNITFEGLLNRHNIFDKHFVNSNNKENLNDSLRRFEDKKGDIKNGLDNYFRTGNSKREIGLRKVAGEDAKTVVENMVNYCENYLAGRKYLDEKIDNINNELSSNTEVQEVTNYSQLFKFDFNPYKIITLEGFADVKLEDENNVDNNNENTEDTNNEMVDSDIGFEDDKSNENEQTIDNTEQIQDNNRGLRDRQIGVAVLLTVAEERYFDYIKILRGLIQE